MSLNLTFLPNDLLQRILGEALGLLIDPGVRIHNAQALALLADAGAEVDFASQLARIPETLVWNTLKTAPNSFTLYNLPGEPVVHYGGDAVHFDPGSAGVNILDAETGQHRRPCTADFVRFVQLVETLPEMDAQSTAFVCADVPEAVGDLYRLYLALNFMQKPIVTGAFTIPTWQVMWEMLALVAGGEAELAARPLAVFDVCPSPPLLWSDLTCQNLIDCARKGVPAQLVSMPLAGVSSPVILASAVVQHTAESLSGVVIHQLAHPGAPIVWGGAPAVFDMRTGVTPMGDAGTWLIDSAYIQVGKSLGLPTHTYMGSSDAKAIDAQAGLESMGGTLLAALSGANMVSGAGMLDFLRCQSFEKLVIDAEAIAMARRVSRGVQANGDGSIALDLMRQAGHRANFLSNPHTLKHLRQEMVLPSPVIDRGSLEAWQRSGSPSMVQRAADRVEQLLSTYRPNALDEKIRQELRAIVAREAQKAGMQELPPLPTS